MKGIVVMDVEIRSARADDAAFLAWLILTAGRAHVKRGIWEVILNEPTVAYDKDTEFRSKYT